MYPTTPKSPTCVVRELGSGVYSIVYCIMRDLCSRWLHIPYFSLFLLGVAVLCYSRTGPSARYNAAPETPHGGRAMPRHCRGNVTALHVRKQTNHHDRTRCLISISTIKLFEGVTEGLWTVGQNAAVRTGGMSGDISRGCIR